MALMSEGRPWTRSGDWVAKAAESPFEVAKRARVSILAVLNFAQIEEVGLRQTGNERRVAGGGYFNRKSTICSLADQESWTKIGSEGVQVLDAPISGGKEGAEAGTLSIMVGGQKENYERCLPILQAMGKNIYYFGGSWKRDSA